MGCGFPISIHFLKCFILCKVIIFRVKDFAEFVDKTSFGIAVPYCIGVELPFFYPLYDLVIIKLPGPVPFMQPAILVNKTSCFRIHVWDVFPRIITLITVLGLVEVVFLEQLLLFSFRFVYDLHDPGFVPYVIDDKVMSIWVCFNRYPAFRAQFFQCLRSQVILCVGNTDRIRVFYSTAIDAFIELHLGFLPRFLGTVFHQGQGILIALLDDSQYRILDIILICRHISSCSEHISVPCIKLKWKYDRKQNWEQPESGRKLTARSGRRFILPF